MLHDRQVLFTTRLLSHLGRCCPLILILIFQLLSLRFEVSVTKWKHIPVDLDDVHWKVDIGEVEVDELKFGLLLHDLLICLGSEGRIWILLIIRFRKTHFYSKN